MPTATRYDDHLALLSGTDPGNPHLVVQMLDSTSRLVLVVSFRIRIPREGLSLLGFNLRRLTFLPVNTSASGGHAVYTRNSHLENIFIRFTLRLCTDSFDLRGGE